MGFPPENILFLYCTVHTHSANSTGRDSLIAWNKNINSRTLSSLQKLSCYSCSYGLSKQDVLSFSSLQQPGPPTQTVYLRIKPDLCNYSLLTSYNQLPPTPQQTLAAPLGSFTRVIRFLFSSICLNDFGLLFWEPARLLLTKGRRRLCLRFLLKAPKNL